ncbi:hypothetical protein ABZP36_034162 [Zizania latifolia]
MPSSRQAERWGGWDAGGALGRVGCGGTLGRRGTAARWRRPLAHQPISPSKLLLGATRASPGRRRSCSLSPLAVGGRADRRTDIPARGRGRRRSKHAAQASGSADLRSALNPAPPFEKETTSGNRSNPLWSPPPPTPPPSSPASTTAPPARFPPRRLRAGSHDRPRRGRGGGAPRRRRRRAPEWSFTKKGTVVSYDERSLMIDGKMDLFFSGAIHYPRSLPEMWPKLIKLAKLGGLNTIETYVFWNGHEPEPRKYYFEGRFNLIRFLKVIQDYNMYAIVRIGPFIQAEWNHGLVWQIKLTKEMEKFVRFIVQKLKDAEMFAPQGGPIILAQIENEYGNIKKDHAIEGDKHLEWAAQMAISTATGVPWIMCKQSSSPGEVIPTCKGRHCGDTWTLRDKNKPRLWTEKVRIGLHSKYHIPRAFLKPKGNLLVIFEEELGKPDGILIQTVRRDDICVHISEHNPAQIKTWETDGNQIKLIAEDHSTRGTLTCPPNRTIQEVVFASFGNPEGPCGNFTTGTCHTPNAKAVVEKVDTNGLKLMHACEMIYWASRDTITMSYKSSTAASSPGEQLSLQYSEFCRLHLEPADLTKCRADRIKQRTRRFQCAPHLAGRHCIHGERRRRPGPPPVAGGGWPRGGPRDPSLLPRAADGAFTPPRAVRPGGTDMSVFRDAVKDYLEATPSAAASLPKRSKPPKSTETLVDSYSGLRIRNLTASPTEITNRLADIRFVRISAIKNLAGGDSFSGCWATARVVLDKGAPRVSAQGKEYSIWKMGALDDSEVSVFLFGDAHAHNSGAVFALFNGNVRMDNGVPFFNGISFFTLQNDSFQSDAELHVSQGRGFSVSVASVGQMMKIGMSADFGICKGKRKDGMSCTMGINKRKGSYCKFHLSHKKGALALVQPRGVEEGVEHEGLVDVGLDLKVEKRWDGRLLHLGQERNASNGGEARHPGLDAEPQRGTEEASVEVGNGERDRENREAQPCCGTQHPPDHRLLACAAGITVLIYENDVLLPPERLEQLRQLVAPTSLIPVPASPSPVPASLVFW